MRWRVNRGGKRFGVLILAVTAVVSCSQNEPISIMPIGDSITQGQARSASYRCYLDAMLEDAGVSFELVGSQTEPFGGEEYECPHDFDRDHEGYWGARIAEAGLEVTPAVEELKPDVALIHLGTNDIYEYVPPADAAADLESLISGLQAAHPTITILVAQIIPCGMKAPLPGRCFSEEVGPAFHDAVAPFNGLSTDESSVIVVDMYSGFDRYDLRDDWHPNDDGEQYMASRWMIAMERAGLLNP